MAQNVYMVTIGEYSDYSVAGIFSTRDLAEAFHKECLKEGNVAELTEIELDAERDHVYGPIYSAWIEKDTGAIVHGPCPSKIWHSVRHPRKCDVVDQGKHFCVESPISAEHAIKVATEARQAYLREHATAACEQ